MDLLSCRQLYILTECFFSCFIVFRNMSRMVNDQRTSLRQIWNSSDSRRRPDLLSLPPTAPGLLLLGPRTAPGSAVYSSSNPHNPLRAGGPSVDLLLSHAGSLCSSWRWKTWGPRKCAQQVKLCRCLPVHYFEHFIDCYFLCDKLKTSDFSSQHVFAAKKRRKKPLQVVALT